MVEELLGVAEELYALPVAEFTATRNTWAKRAHADGSAELATAITALRKPSTAAWLVNMMMRHQGEQMAQVLTLGASLREAQESLDGTALRELARQRRQLTSAVTRQGRALSTELGQRVTDDVARQVEDTLHAAMVDPAAASAVQSGLLITALAATGVGDLDVVDAVALPSAIGLTARARPIPARVKGRPALSVVPEPEMDRDAERREAQERATAAREAADTAAKKLKKARHKLAAAEALTLQLRAELEEVRRRVGALEQEIEVADEDAAKAEERVDRAAARYADAQESLDQARSLL